MAYHRQGQDRWVEWEGEGYEPRNPDSIVYFTLGYVDTNAPTKISHIASALRRDGIADGWAESFKMLETVVGLNAYVTETDDGDYLFWNDEDEPIDGALYEPATFVEIPIG